MAAMEANNEGLNKGSGVQLPAAIQDAGEIVRMLLCAKLVRWWPLQRQLLVTLVR